MRKRSPHLIIADPGLRGASGHHPAAALTLARSGGFSSVLVCAHREADPALEQWLQAPGLKFERHFSRYLYERESLDRPMSAALADIRALADEYADLVARTAGAGKAGSPPADTGVLMLHHTADWLQVAAIGQMLQRQPAGSRPLAHTPQHLIFLTHAPGVAHSGQVHSPRRLLNWRIALASLKGRRDVALFTSCEELRQIYAQFCGLGEAIGVHPVFHFDAPDWAVSAASRRPRLKKRQAQQLLLYVGDAKEAKGFVALPSLVKALLARTPLTLTLQFGLESGLRSPRIDEAAASLGALAAAHPRRVRLVRRYVDEVELKTLMLGCSGMVFNYQAARYADQTSGVLWQAAAAGLHVWCVGESWLTREARRLLPGGVKVVSDPAALVAALESTFRIGASTSTAKREPEPLHEQEREAQTAYRTALFQPLAGFLLDQLHRCAQKPPLARLADPRIAPQPGSHDPAAPLALVIDEHPPAPVRSAGHHAAWQEMLLLSAIGMRVCVGSTSHEAIEPGIQDELAMQGLEWVGAAKELAGFLQRHGSAIGIVYLTRFHVAERVLPWVRKTAPQARVLLNLADLHHLRIEREARLSGKADLLRHAAAIQARECAVMAQVDTVLTYTEEEATLIHAQMQGRVDVQRLPWVDEVRHGTIPGPKTRRDLLFVGAFSHAPNVDALLWFAKEVMPLLRQRLPGVRLRVCGSDPTSSIQALHGPDVLIEGFVDDLAPVYDACRLFVAPLRFGAGIKGKVAAALGAGLPVVASPVAAEGFVEAGTMGVAAIAQTPQQWSEYIALLCLNAQAWQCMSTSALAYASRRLSWEVGVQAMREICN